VCAYACNVHAFNKLRIIGANNEGDINRTLPVVFCPLVLFSRTVALLGIFHVQVDRLSPFYR